VALLLSDHIWLWARGYEGGGPYTDLLRRLAHWLMKEPDLEEEALWVEPAGQTMRIIRRTLSEEVPEVTIRRTSAFISQPLAMNSTASQSSSSGWEGYSPCMPRSSTAADNPVPKNCFQSRLTNVRAAGLPGASWSARGCASSRAPACARSSPPSPCS